MESCLAPVPDVVVGPGGPVPGLGLASVLGPRRDPNCRSGQGRRGGPLRSHPPCLPHSPAGGSWAARLFTPRAWRVSALPQVQALFRGPCGPATEGGSCSVTLGLDTLGFRQGRADFLIRALLEGKVTAGLAACVLLQWERAAFSAWGWEVCALQPRPAWDPLTHLPPSPAALRVT